MIARWKGKYKLTHVYNTYLNVRLTSVVEHRKDEGTDMEDFEVITYKVIYSIF